MSKEPAPEAVEGCAGFGFAPITRPTQTPALPLSFYQMRPCLCMSQYGLGAARAQDYLYQGASVEEKQQGMRTLVSFVLPGTEQQVGPARETCGHRCRRVEVDSDIAGVVASGGYCSVLARAVAVV